MNCIHENTRMQNKCGLLHDTVPCKGVRCEWYQTGEMKLNSLVKAARTWMENHPNGDLREVVPDNWLDKVKRVLDNQ